MALRKVLGTETEYGIMVRNQPDFNPMLASLHLINAYPGNRAQVKWSFAEESPGRDARGFGPRGSLPSGIESALVNLVLPNGARLYVDHAHPEYSTPECSNPRDVARFDKAGERVMSDAVATARSTMPQEERMYVYKNNSDGKGRSYGAHENYLVPRAVPFGEIVRHMTGFLVTRQIYTGSGKVGSENGRPEVFYQLTQRGDFFEAEVGLETTLKRPIINTRDEPHADSSKYRRLHVILGDSNMAEPQTFLKIGATALILCALEDGALGHPIALEDATSAVWRVSHALDLTEPVKLDNGRTLTPIDAQWQYLEWAKDYLHGSDLDDVYGEVVSLWEEVLTDLEVDPMRCADRLDWVAKLQLLEGFRARDHLKWSDPKLHLVDLQYHDVDPERGLYYQLVAAGKIRRLFSDSEISDASTNPPTDTRAYFRGRSVEKFRDALVSANWDALVFETGEEVLKRVPMMDPFRGTKDLVDDLLEESETPADLLRVLEGADG